MYDVETPLCSARCKNKVAKIVNFTQLHGFKLRWISCVTTIFRELDRFFQEKRDRKRNNLVRRSIILLEITFFAKSRDKEIQEMIFSRWPEVCNRLLFCQSFLARSAPSPCRIIMIIIMTMKDHHHDHHHHDHEGSSSPSPPCRTINTIVVTFFLVQADCELQPITINMHYKRAAKVTFELLGNYNSFKNMTNGKS